MLVHYIDGKDIGAFPRQESGVHSVAGPFITQFASAHPGFHTQGDASVHGNRDFLIVPVGIACSVVLPIGVEAQGLGIPPEGIKDRILCQHQGISGLIVHLAVILQGPAQKIMIVPNRFWQRDLAVLLRGDGIQIIAAVYREFEGAALPLRQGGWEQSRKQHQAEQQGQGLFPSVFHRRPPCCYSCLIGLGPERHCFRFPHKKTL